MLVVAQPPRTVIKQEIDQHEVERAYADTSIVPHHLKDKPPHARQQYLLELLDRFEHSDRPDKKEMKCVLLRQYLECSASAEDVRFVTDNMHVINEATKMLCMQDQAAMTDIDIVANNFGVRICDLVVKNSISEQGVSFRKPQLNGTSDTGMHRGTDYNIVDGTTVVVSLTGVMKLLRWHSTPVADLLYRVMMTSTQIVHRANTLNQDFSRERRSNLIEHASLREFEHMNFEKSASGDTNFLLNLERAIHRQILALGNKTIEQITGMQGSNRSVQCNKAYVEYSNVVRQELGEELEEASQASVEAGDTTGKITLAQQDQITAKMLNEVVPRIFARYSDPRRSQAKFLVAIPQSLRQTQELRTRNAVKTIVKTMRVNHRMKNN